MYWLDKKNQECHKGAHGFSLQVKGARKSVVLHNKKKDVQTFSGVIS